MNIKLSKTPIRNHTEEYIQKMIDSINELGGICNPIVIFRSGTICDGSLRYIAAKRLGIDIPFRFLGEIIVHTAKAPEYKID